MLAMAHQRAQGVYAAFGHLESSPKSRHAVCITFAVDFNGSQQLIDYHSDTHEPSPGFYYAAIACMEKFWRPGKTWIDRFNTERRSAYKTGLYAIITTYEVGRESCFVSPKYATLHHLSGGDAKNFLHSKLGPPKTVRKARK